VDQGEEEEEPEHEEGTVDQFPQHDTSPSLQRIVSCPQ
jgi:hypothetical protein